MAQLRHTEYQFISSYRRRFTLPERLNGRRLVVEFDGAQTVSTVSLNGVQIGTHAGGYTPFSFDLTDGLREGENVLDVSLDSTERPDVPPNGGVVDYLTFGGIYREARLHVLPAAHIADVFVKPSDLLTDLPRTEIDVTLRNHGPARSVRLSVAVEDGGSAVASGEQAVSLAAGETRVVTVPLALPANLRLWSPADPYRYAIACALDDEAGASLDDYGAFPFGFREAIFTADGLLLNGEKVKLLGLNRHQTYPYIGEAAPARLQRKDADILKYELGVQHRPHVALPAVAALPRPLRRDRPARVRGNPRLAVHRRQRLAGAIACDMCSDDRA